MTLVTTNEHYCLFPSCSRKVERLAVNNLDQSRSLMQLMTGDDGADRGRLYLEIRNLEPAVFFCVGKLTETQPHDQFQKITPCRSHHSRRLMVLNSWATPKQGFHHMHAVSWKPCCGHSEALTYCKLYGHLLALTSVK